MADSNIKKVTITNSELPYVSYDEDGLFYNIRYRIISDDRNRSSYWSSFIRVEVPPTEDADLPYTSEERIHINTIGSSPVTILTTWTHPQDGEYNPDPEKETLEKIFSEVTEFDIFVRWNENNAPDNINWTDWEFEANVSANSFPILKPSTINLPGNPAPKQIEIAVQIPTTVKTRDQRLTLFLTKSNI